MTIIEVRETLEEINTKIKIIERKMVITRNTFNHIEED